jgi:hypothetical protein
MEALYMKNRMLTTSAVRAITKKGAFLATRSAAASCEAPAKMIKDMAIAWNGSIPTETTVTPTMAPKGNTPARMGEIAFMPSINDFRDTFFSDMVVYSKKNKKGKHIMKGKKFNRKKGEKAN